MVTKFIALENLKKYEGQNLLQYAKKFNINAFVNGKQNKGWKGQVLERLAGLENNNSKAPNGLGFELKSVSFRKDKNNCFVPKETMAITMLNPKELLEYDFLNSHVWSKLKSLILCIVEWKKPNQEDFKLLKIISIDYLQDDLVIKNIENDYNLIKNHLKNNGLDSIKSNIGTYIQARTKGKGHGTKSRCFYAKKPLIFDLVKDSDINP